MSIRLAILGAGLFARLEHIPNILALGDTFRIMAVMARTVDSTQAAADRIPYPVAQVHSLDDLHARDDIDAVDMLLPIADQPAVIPQVWQAGKHVLSEKPIAPTTAQAQHLLDTYAALDNPPLWMVAENWRYAPAIQRAKELMDAGSIGQPMMFHWAIYANATPQMPYYNTGWRANPQHPYGYLLDGGIHFMAGLREILGEVQRFQSVTRHLRDDLPAPDTVCATVEMASGLIGTFSLTYATGVPDTTYLTIAGTKGTLEVNRDALRLTVDGTEKETFSGRGKGVRSELKLFADMISGNADSDAYKARQRAFGDLETFERLLSAAQNTDPSIS